ncbi:MAG: hypothetical protein RR035_08105 [Oscillibacter sp.]
MKQRFSRAVRFGCRNYLKGAAIFCIILLLLNVVFMTVIPAVFDGGSSFTGWGMLCAFFLLVLGIAGFRENHRMFAQNGVSRRTGFWADIAALVITSAALALFGELLMAVMQALTQGSNDYFVADLYQLIYQDVAEVVTTLTLSQHVISGLFNFTLFLLVALFGEWFSALFWRLNKFWTIAAGVLFFAGCNLLPWLLVQSPILGPILIRAGESLVLFVLTSPWNAMLVFLSVSAFFGLFNWLLLRNTHLRGI